MPPASLRLNSWCLILLRMATSHEVAARSTNKLIENSGAAAASFVVYRVAYRGHQRQRFDALSVARVR